MSAVLPDFLIQRFEGTLESVQNLHSKRVKESTHFLSPNVSKQKIKDSLLVPQLFLEISIVLLVPKMISNVSTWSTGVCL